MEQLIYTSITKNQLGLLLTMASDGFHMQNVYHRMKQKLYMSKVFQSDLDGKKFILDDLVGSHQKAHLTVPVVFAIFAPARRSNHEKGRLEHMLVHRDL